MWLRRPLLRSCRNKGRLRLNRPGFCPGCLLPPCGACPLLCMLPKPSRLLPFASNHFCDVARVTFRWYRVLWLLVCLFLPEACVMEENFANPAFQIAHPASQIRETITFGFEVYKSGVRKRVKFDRRSVDDGRCPAFWGRPTLPSLRPKVWVGAGLGLE